MTKSIPIDLQEQRRATVANIFEGIQNASTDIKGSRSVTPGETKNYFQFIDLVQKALSDYQSRLKTPEDKRIKLTWEEPDFKTETETITVGLVRRVPGSFDQGAPFEGSVKNLRPVLREVKQDSEHPGYRNLYLGYLHDNQIRFTCWALTNKEAIERSLWFEQFMNKYTWFFRVSGVARVLFLEQGQDVFVNNSGNKFYGRPLDYFVRTEDIEIVSEKQIEDISFDISVGQI